MLTTWLFQPVNWTKMHIIKNTNTLAIIYSIDDIVLTGTRTSISQSVSLSAPVVSFHLRVFAAAVFGLASSSH